MRCRASTLDWILFQGQHSEYSATTLQAEYGMKMPKQVGILVFSHTFWKRSLSLRRAYFIGFFYVLSEFFSRCIFLTLDNSVLAHVHEFWLLHFHSFFPSPYFQILTSVT